MDCLTEPGAFYPQCNSATQCHNWSEFIRLHAELLLQPHKTLFCLFHISGNTLQDLDTNLNMYTWQSCPLREKLALLVIIVYGGYNNNSTASHITGRKNLTMS